MTGIASNIFDAIEFAWAEKAMVEIVGDSRFGKTEAVKTWCAMFPGKARLVRTPCDNCDRSLLEAIAEAAGIELTLKTTLRQLKAKLEFVLKHSGLMLILDESAWLIPQRYSVTTAPVRLNYVRSQILDNGCPVVLVTTPQFFGAAAMRFEKTTGFNMAQFKGRIMRTVSLPRELSDHDLRSIVKHHLPGLKEAFVNLIVGHALTSESYIFAVEKIAKNARAVAAKKGHAAIETEDLQAGIELAGLNLRISAPPPAVQTPRVARSSKQKGPTASTHGRRTVPPLVETPPRGMTPDVELSMRQSSPVLTE